MKYKFKNIIALFLILGVVAWLSPILVSASSSNNNSDIEKQIKGYLNSLVLQNNNENSQGKTVSENTVKIIANNINSVVTARAKEGKELTDSDIESILTSSENLVFNDTGVHIDLKSDSVLKTCINNKYLSIKNSVISNSSNSSNNISGQNTSSVTNSSSSTNANTYDSSNPKISIVNPPSGDASSSNVGSIFDMCANVNNSLWNDEIFIDKKIDSSGNWIDEKNEFLSCNYSSTDKICNISVNMARYNKLDNSEQQKIMQRALDGVYSSNITRTNKNKIYNELCNLDKSTASLVRQLSDDVNADFGEAYNIFKPFSGVVGTILGLASLLIFLMIALTMIVDIAYLTLPFVQLMLTSDSEKKAKFVSLEAFNAIKEQQSKVGQEYINPLGIYLKSKSKQFIALFICLLYLVSGEIYNLLANMMDYFSGILG